MKEQRGGDEEEMAGNLIADTEFADAKVTGMRVRMMRDDYK